MRPVFTTLLLVAAFLSGISRAEPPAARPAIRIGLVSDPHVGDGPAERAYVRHFRAVIDEVNAAGVDAVLLAGDLTQSGKPAEMKLFLDVVKTFRAPVVRFVAGNHDVGNKPMPGAKASFNTRRLEAFERNVGPLYFAADVAPGVRVVGITSALLGTGLPQEQAQWTFVEEQLKSARENGATPLLLTHYPPFVRTPDEADEYFNMNRAPRARLLKLLDDNGVGTILAGHLHRPIDVSAGPVHVIGAPAVSFGLPPGVQREGWTLVTLTPGGTATAELHYLPRDPASASRPAAGRPARPTTAHAAC